MRKSNLKVQLKSFDLQKESIESELRKSNYDQKKFGYKICLKPNFKFVKTMFKLINWKEGFETKILALFSLDLDERLKSCEGLKIRG